MGPFRGRTGFRYHTQHQNRNSRLVYAKKSLSDSSVKLSYSVISELRGSVLHVVAFYEATNNLRDIAVTQVQEAGFTGPIVETLEHSYWQMKPK